MAARTMRVDLRCFSVLTDGDSLAAAHWNVNGGSGGVVTFSPEATVVTPPASVRRGLRIRTNF